MTPIDIQVSRSKAMPFLYMLGKGGISVLQTSIFSSLNLNFASYLHFKLIKVK